jgi:hypothetical protein
MLRQYLTTDVSNRIFRNNFGAILHSWLKSVVANSPGYSRAKGSEILKEIPGRIHPGIILEGGRDEKRRYPVSIDQRSPGDRRISAALEIGFQ